jgi:putative DNA primase/helicase
VPNAHNAHTILANDAEWRGVLAWDELAHAIRKLRPPPGIPLDPGPYWADSDSTATRAWLERKFSANSSFPSALIYDTVQLVAKRRATHPVRDYLQGLTWDKTPRLDGWLVTYLHCADSPYTRAVGAKWLISAVARAFKPGCKVDHVLVLEGDGGIGKSTALRSLCPQEEWFLDSSVDLSSVEAYKVIRRKWVVEFGELASVSKAELEKVKSFITSACDTYRPSYARVEVDQPRACVFAGSTNDAEYLKDDTGGIRRFWPVACEGAVDLEGLAAARDQLWAEACARYKSGEEWHLNTPELVAAAREAQEDRRVVDPWETQIVEWLACNRRSEFGVSTYQILHDCLFLDDSKNTKATQMRVAGILKAIGWEKAGRPDRKPGDVDDKRPRLYKPKPKKYRPEDNF